jgi:hypothetical protein
MKDKISSGLKYAKIILKWSDIPIFFIQYVISWHVLNTMTYQINAVNGNAGDLLFLTRSCSSTEIFNKDSIGNFTTIRNSTCVIDSLHGFPITNVQSSLRSVDHASLFFSMMIGLTIKAIDASGLVFDPDEISEKFVISLYAFMYYLINSLIFAFFILNPTSNECND